MRLAGAHANYFYLARAMRSWHRETMAAKLTMEAAGYCWLEHELKGAPVRTVRLHCEIAAWVECSRSCD